MSDYNSGLFFALIAALGAIVAAIIGVVASRLIPSTPKGRLHLQSVSVVERDFFPALDVKLNNTTANSIIIDRIEIIILDRAVTPVRTSVSPNLEVSHAYNFLIDPLESKSVIQNVSLAMPPHSADRIVIIMGAFCGTGLPASAFKNKKVLGSAVDELRKPNNSHTYRISDCEISFKIQLHYDKGKMLRSPIQKATIRIEPHFSPGRELAISLVESYTEGISGGQTTGSIADRTL